MSQCRKMLAAYTPEQVERLEAAAASQVDRINAAAIDPTDSTVQDGVDIGELWFAVVRRRNELRREFERLGDSFRATIPKTPSEVVPEPQEAALPVSEAPTDTETPEKAPAAPKAPVKRRPARPRKT